MKSNTRMLVAAAVAALVAGALDFCVVRGLLEFGRHRLRAHRAVGGARLDWATRASPAAPGRRILARSTHFSIMFGLHAFLPAGAQRALDAEARAGRVAYGWPPSC
jgi:hypothetical protein